LINFGIPPLLFTQVLYGSFLYTSSVLIGAWWLSVVFLVIFVYSALYAGSLRAEKPQAWWGYGLVALVAAIAVAKIYSTTMTLMLRPEVWVEMFRANPHGTGLPPHDPTVIPRWLFMLTGALAFGGLGLVVMGSRQKPGVAGKGFLVVNGGWIAAAGALLQMAAGWRVFHTQPEAVIARLGESPLYHMLPGLWLGLAAGVAALGLLAVALREKATGWLATAAGLAGLLLTATWVVYRDGIRDATLLASGYNVWDLKVVANWPVVALFVGLFLLGLLVTGWMAAVVLRAKPKSEEPAP